MTRRLSRPVLAVGLVGVLAACGVPAETAPRPVEPPAGVHQGGPPPAPTATQSGLVVERLYLVRDDELVPVIRRLRAPLSASAHLDLLLGGPNDDEQRAGISTALTGPGNVLGVRVAAGEAVVDIGDGLAATGRNDEVIAFGQIVLTLTARPNVDRVSFQHDGEPVGIPRADGSLSRTPLTAADYASLTPAG